MSFKEERILGAITMTALSAGAEIDISRVGGQGLFRARLPDKEATLWLKLDGGTELIGDATGSPDIYIGLLEAAQNVCEEIWRDE